MRRDIGFFPSAEVSANQTQVHFRIIATTDLHAHLMPWDYLADCPAALGLAQLAPLIRHLRAEAPNCLLLDNGDFLQGSALGDWAEGAGGPHPMVQAMNALGYDAGTLGNHEFSHGLPLLLAALAEARFPVVSANLERRGGPLAPPFTMIDRMVTGSDGRMRPLRIAITGFAPPQTTGWEAVKLGGEITAQDILPAARAVLERIEAARPDLTIALAHTGIAEAQESAGMENAARPLAALAGIDVIVAGHTHLTFPQGAETLNGKPAVMSGFFGSHLGVIDLVLDQDTAGWRVLRHQAQAMPTPKRPSADRDLAALAGPAHLGTLAAMRRRIGRTPQPLHSHFALVAPSAITALVAQAQTAHIRSLIPPALSHLPLLCAVAPFRTGGRGGAGNITDIPAGALLHRHVTDLYGHPNTSAVLRLTGAEVADWLERAAILFHRIAADADDAPLIRDDIPGFDFDLIHGVSFRIDLSRPPRFDARGSLLDQAARRVTDLTYGGAAIDPEQEFLLATNSYRAGGGSFPGTQRAPVAQSPRPIRDLLADHITAQGALTPPPLPDWGFAAMEQATVTFDTGPAALRYIGEIAHLRPEPLGQTGTGFLRFRLTL